MNLNLKYLMGKVEDEESNLKKEILKVIIVNILLLKNRSNKKWINIYNNFVFFRKKKCDIYFENIKRKEAIVFKIVNRKTEEGIDKMVKELESMDFDSFDKEIMVLDVNNFSNDIREMDNQVREIL